MFDVRILELHLSPGLKESHSLLWTNLLLLRRKMMRIIIILLTITIGTILTIVTIITIVSPTHCRWSGGILPSPATGGALHVGRRRLYTPARVNVRDFSFTFKHTPEQFRIGSCWVTICRRRCLHRLNRCTCQRQFRTILRQSPWEIWRRWTE